MGPYIRNNILKCLNSVNSLGYSDSTPSEISKERRVETIITHLKLKYFSHDEGIVQLSQEKS